MLAKSAKTSSDRDVKAAGPGPGAPAGSGRHLPAHGVFLRSSAASVAQRSHCGHAPVRQNRAPAPAREGESMGDSSKTGAGGASFDRRIFLGGALAPGAEVLAAACGSSATVNESGHHPPGRVRPRSHRARGVPDAGEPVVRPLLRRVQGRPGFGDHPAGNLGVFSQAFPGNTFGPRPAASFPSISVWPPTSESAPTT